MPWERRGSFTSAVNKLRWKHGLGQEDLSWSALGPRSAELARDVVEKFFRTRWLWYHCAIVEKDVSTAELASNEDRARHCARLLRVAMDLFKKDGTDKRFSFRCAFGGGAESARAVRDEIEQRLAARSERLGRQLEFKASPEAESLGLQVCDLLTGAVATSFGEDVPSQFQHMIIHSVADCLGWESLRGDSPAGEWKFNIASTREYNAGRYRAALRRQVRHKYRLSGYRRSERDEGAI